MGKEQGRFPPPPPWGRAPDLLIRSQTVSSTALCPLHGDGGYRSAQMIRNHQSPAFQVFTFFYTLSDDVQHSA